MPTNTKRKKPHADWPMFWHQSGYWCKKVAGKQWYFGYRGSVDDPPEFDREAEDDYNRNITSIRAGAGRVVEDGAGVDEVVRDFTSSRMQLVSTGELSLRTYRDYEYVGRLVTEHFGDTTFNYITADSLARLKESLGEGRSVTSLANYVRISRIILRYGHVELGLKTPPMSQFTEPPRKARRRDRNRRRREHGVKMFEAAQIRAILESAHTSEQMYAMTLLGVNCGYGNKDCSELRFGQWTKQDGRIWLDSPRVKTEVERRCVLWPETIKALEDAAKVRPKPIHDRYKNYLFLTRNGRPWVRDASGTINDEISKQYSKLLGQVTDPTTGQSIKRPGLSFYALRHTTLTIGERVRDPVAMRVIMGHVDDSMAGVYREMIEDDRIVAVCDHVRNWLFGN